MPPALVAPLDGHGLAVHAHEDDAAQKDAHGAQHPLRAGEAVTHTHTGSACQCCQSPARTHIAPGCPRGVSRERRQAGGVGNRTTQRAVGPHAQSSAPSAPPCRRSCLASAWLLCAPHPAALVLAGRCSASLRRGARDTRASLRQDATGSVHASALRTAVVCAARFASAACRAAALALSPPCREGAPRRVRRASTWRGNSMRRSSLSSGSWW